MSRPDSIERLDPRLDALIPSDARLETVAEGHLWTEGPLWDASDGSLLFSDVPRNAIYRWKAGSGVSLFLPDSGYTGDAPFRGREPGSNGLAFDREGRLVMCQHGNRRIARREGGPDGLKVDRDGNVFAANPGGVHVFAPDGTRLGRIETGVATGNLAWGEDGSTLFIAAGHSILRLRTSTRGYAGMAGR